MAFVDRLPQFEARLTAALGRAASRIALVLEAYAKTHHAWLRDTGMTDATTKGTWEEAAEGVVVVLSAGMDYDVYLEAKPQWAWLRPAIEANHATMRAIITQELRA